jgi:hypothetical protein
MAQQNADSAANVIFRVFTLEKSTVCMACAALAIPSITPQTLLDSLYELARNDSENVILIYFLLHLTVCILLT